MNAKQEFSGLRGIFFPIHAYELKKILPLGIMLFIILFNHYCLKNLKDSLIVTNIGAEAIAFIKLFCVPPGAILGMLLYTKMSDRLKNEHLFFVTLGFFVGFFILFTTVLYPCREFIHPSKELVVHYQVAYPSFFWAFAIWGVWSYAIFFVLAELWSSFIMTLLFWQFVNQITELEEARRVYAFLAFMGQGAVALSGVVGTLASDIKNKVGVGVDPWQVTLNYLIGIVFVSSLVAMYLYHWVYKNVLTDKRFYKQEVLPGIKPKKKKRTSVLESLKLAIKSPIVGLIALLVICYGINDNIIENFWKYELGHRYPDINQYNAFMCRYTFTYGTLSMFVLIIAGNIFRRFRWGVGALVTPIVVTIGGVLMFSTMLCENVFVRLLGSSLIYHTIIVFLGVSVLVFVKSTKMSFFDLSKEMAYIPLDEEMKVKGKAVVDVLGYRFGKSGGSGLQVILLVLVGMFTGTKASYATIAPYAYVVFLLTSLIWFVAVLRLSRRIRIQQQISQGNDNH